MSLTINGATNTLTAASGLAIAGNTAVTGTLSATGAITGAGTHGAGSFNGFIIKNTATSAGSGKLSWHGNTDNEIWSVAVNQSVGATFLEFNYLTVNKAYLSTSALTLGAGVAMVVADTTDATSTTAASFKTAGGLAVAKKTYCGDNIVMDSGKGIDFSATANGSGTMTSEVLSDYEEGTWTPVLTDLTNNATSAGTTRGRYTKVGRQVTVQGWLDISSLGSVSGPVYISGLPFTVATFESASMVGRAGNLAISAGQSVGIYSSSGTSLGLYLWDDAAGTTAMTGAEFSSDGFIAFAHTYTV